MAKRKKAPKAAPRIDVVEDGKKVSVRSDGTETLPKRRRVGVAQGVRMASPVTGLKMGGVPVTAGDIRDDYEAQQVSAEHNDRLRKAQESELANPSEITQARRNSLVTHSAQMPSSTTEGVATVIRSASTGKRTVTVAGRKTRTKSVRADVAAGPAVLPASGTAPGAAPTGTPDDTNGRVVTVRPGLGAPDANPAPGGRRTMRSLQDRIAVRSRAKNRTSGKGRKVSTENLGSLSEKVTTDKTQRSFRSAPAGGKAEQRRKKYATVARNADVVTEASRLRRNNPTPGKWATDKDTTAAVKAGHITYEQAAELSPKYMADIKSVAPVKDYIGSDKAMAHELASTHLKGVTAEHIMSYASANNITVQSLHKEIRNNATGQGKLTNWVLNPKTGSREPFHWRKSGSKRISGRDASGANITKTAQHPTSAPEGSLSHIDYIKNQIQKHVDNTKLDTADARKAKGRGRSESTKTAMFVQSQLANNTGVEGVTQTNILTGGDTTTQTRLVNKETKAPVKTPSGADAVTPPKKVSPVANTVESAQQDSAPLGSTGRVQVDSINPVLGTANADSTVEKPKKGFTQVPKPKNTMR